MDDRLLGIYLNDHLAGATGGLELAQRLHGRNQGTEYEERLGRLAQEIREDRDTLLTIMSRLGAVPNPLKTRAAWAAERLGRLKMNGRVLAYSPLSRVEEMEAMRLGVDGKRSLWRALKETRGADPRLEGIDLQELIARAERQSEELEAMRLSAATGAFGSAPARSPAGR
jgi:hypothetical protein